MSVNISTTLQQVHVHQQSIGWIPAPATETSIAKPQPSNTIGRVIFRAGSWCHYQTYLGSITRWSGSLVAGPKGGDWDSPKPLDRLRRGGGHGIVIRPLGCSRYSRNAIMILFKMYRVSQGSLSFQWSISFTSVLPKNADIFRLVRQGNIHGVKSIFSAGKGAPSDTTADGTGLLHVCPPL